MMKILSLWQPWASLVACGAKKVETRSWQTPYRGWLAVHAAKRFAREEQGLCYYVPSFGKYLPEPGRLPLGAIVAVARLVAIESTNWPWGHRPDWLTEEERAFGNYLPNRFAWFLEDVRALPEPIPCRGSQGLRPVSGPVAEELRAFLLER